MYAFLICLNDHGEPLIQAQEKKNLIQMQLSCFQIKSRFFSYILGLKKRPGAVIGICLTVVTFAVSVTVFVSTMIYWNSVKKSRVKPQGKIRKIIRRPVP